MRLSSDIRSDIRHTYSLYFDIHPQNVTCLNGIAVSFTF